MAQTDSRYFAVWDYVVFGIMLLLSAVIGIYSALTGGRQRTADEFFLGNRQMGIIPVAMSVMVSFVSAISVIGTPGEIYMYDSMFFWSLLTYAVSNTLICRLFLPIFFRLRITSVNEYLEMRFSRVVRLCSSIIFSVQTIIYMGIAMYTPALAINAVTGMDLWACVVSTGAVCIFYTTVGGMKAVLWTDTLQSVIIIFGVIAVIIKGSIAVGGIGEVWKRGVQGGRLQFFEVSPDPRIRYTLWSFLFGMMFTNLALGVNQTIAQRLFSCGSRKNAEKALFLATIFKFITVGMCIFSGIVMYAYYVDCDPYTQGVVQSKDQIMPLLVMDLFGNMPGLPGLFLSAVVSASISTLSSGVNSLAALTGEDGLKLIWPEMSTRTYARVIKIVALFYGLVSIGFAFLASLMGQGVLQLALSLFGITAGSGLGVFLLGIFVHRSNSKGAISGMAASCLFTGWLKLGSLLYPSIRGINGLSVEGCPVPNTTAYYYETTWIDTNTSSPSAIPDLAPRPAIANLYDVSFLYYAPIGLVICMVVGTVVSAATGFTDPDTIDPRLKGNVTDAVFCCFPESLKRWMRCGMDKITQYEDEEGDEEVKDMRFMKLPPEKTKETSLEERKRMLQLDRPRHQKMMDSTDV